MRETAATSTREGRQELDKKAQLCGGCASPHQGVEQQLAGSSTA